MDKYRELVKSEARTFFKENHEEFVSDEGEFGGASSSPNFLKWLDRTRKLNGVVEKTVARWGPKEFQWVQSNTRNPAPIGGDPRSNAFGSFYLDVLHELKKLNKKKTSS